MHSFEFYRQRFVREGRIFGKDLSEPPMFHLTGDWDRFSQRMKTYASIWCCIHAHPGHIHYDMLWDVPHTDKFNRIWTKWEAKTGP